MSEWESPLLAVSTLEKHAANVSGEKTTETPSPGLLIAMQTLIILTMAVGIPGNLLVITVILAHRKLQNAGGVLILALSISDVLYFSVILPIRFITFHNAQWPWSDVFCQFTGGFAHCCLGASISLMSAIAFSRYLHVLHPNFYRTMFGKKGLAIQLTILWSVILLFTTVLPMADVLGHYAFLEQVLSCTYDPESDMIFKYVTLSCSLAVPIGFTTICYSLIYCKVKTTHKNLAKWTLASRKIHPEMEHSVTITMDEATEDFSHPKVSDPRHEPSISVLERVVEESFTAVAITHMTSNVEPEPPSHTPKTTDKQPQPILKLPHLKRPKALKNVSISLDRNIFTHYRQNSFSRNRNKTSRWRRDSFKMTLMMATAFGVFITTLAPYAVLSLVDEQQENASGYLLTLALSWLNGCVNPIIYVAMNTQYRRAVMRMCRCCAPWLGSEESQAG